MTPLVLLALLVAVPPADADSPVSRVIELLAELKAGIEADGKKEGASYDTFACYCESTLAEKAAAISTAKSRIAELQNKIDKLGGAVASYAVEIKQLDKDIAKNMESQKEAEGMREKEKEDYVDEKLESEQCVGALEAAIKVLAGAGTGSSKFLETLQATKLLSVAGGLRTVLSRPDASQRLVATDLDVMNRFVDHPQEFLAGHGDGFAATQLNNNPFGDYAPKSGQVQGILKGMYESFSLGLEKSNAEEAQKEKAFQELMATKKAEYASLTTTLGIQKTAAADSEKDHADSKTERDDTAEQLKADETFFDETKASCKEKARQWALRTRLRTEELQGISQAVAILSSPEATQTFENATTSFAQLANVRRHGPDRREEAYEKLKLLASNCHSVGLARVAVKVKMGGHFNKVIAIIEKMITQLKAEEKDDVKQRDTCIDDARKNTNELEDIAFSTKKTEELITRLENEKKEKVARITSLDEEINASSAEEAELRGKRGEEWDSTAQANKDDREAIVLLEKAIVELTRFYSKNKIGPSLLEREEPPADPFQDGAYAGRHAESGGIVAILTMIKEDLEKEIGASSAADAASQEVYEKELNALQETLDANRKSRNAVNEELIRLRVKLDGEQQDLTQLGADKDAKEEQKAGIETDCAWVETHFDSRLEKRRNEIAGLKDAKHLLMGVPVS